MKSIRDALVRLGLFAGVFIAWMWVLAQPFSSSVNLAVIVGCVLLVFPIVWFARLVLDRDPTPGNAEWITTLVHAVVMVLFGSAVIRAVTTYQAWRGWVMPIPREVGLLLAIIFGVAAALAVLTLAVRGLGAPFGIALSRRLAIDWLYAWSRNPMVLASLALLVAVGIWFQSGLFVLWACLLVIPALLFFVKLFEERELEIRFGESYRQYRARTPMLLPRKPASRRAAPVTARKARKSATQPRSRGKRTTK
jgi:protein-S-isoprenylcysteine O-methyltransferase Ste14